MIGRFFSSPLARSRQTPYDLSGSGEARLRPIAPRRSAGRYRRPHRLRWPGCTPVFRIAKTGLGALRPTLASLDARLIGPPARAGKHNFRFAHRHPVDFRFHDRYRPPRSPFERGRPVGRGGIQKFDERRARHGEEIGGGFFVFRRGRTTGRIKPSPLPVEYDSLERAGAAAKQMLADRPGGVFDIFERVATVPAPEGPIVTVLGVEVSLTPAAVAYLVDHLVIREVGVDAYELVDDVDVTANEKVHKLMLALCHPRALERRP